MPDQSALLLFIAASLALLVVPGPAVLYIVMRSIDQGRAAGFASTLGVGLGSLVHVSGAALGLSALLLSSALAFSLVKYLGAAYLIFLGARKLLNREQQAQSQSTQPQALRRVFYQGVLVNTLNPKTALFFFAFLPQFVDPARGSVTIQILLLGALFVAMGIVSDGLYALVASTVRERLAGSMAFFKGQRYFAGSVYILLGLTTAFSGAKNK